MDIGDTSSLGRRTLIKEYDKMMLSSGIEVAPITNKYIFIVNMGEQYVQDLLPDIEKILNDPRSSNYEYNLAGQMDSGRQIQIREDQFTPNLNNLKQAVESMARAYIDRFFLASLHNKEDFKGVINLHDIWIVEQKNGDYNPLHTHKTKSPAGLSGVLYIKTPPQILNPKKNKDGRGIEKTHAQGKIKITTGDKVSADLTSLESSQLMIFDPIPGRLLLFPKNTAHSVDPFYGDGDRICLAFNVNIWYQQPGK